jgi:hypothetical protein
MLEPLDFQLAQVLVDALDSIFDMVIFRQKDGVNAEVMKRDTRLYFNIIARCFGIFNVHSIFNKKESEDNYSYKKKCMDLFTKLDTMTEMKTLETFLPLHLSSLRHQIMNETSV